MGEKGFSLVEVLLSLVIAGILLSASLTLFQQEIHDSGRLEEEWKAYWAVKARMKDWQNDRAAAAQDDGLFTIGVTERRISQTVWEGVFTVQWPTPNYGKQTFYAYKTAGP